MIVDEVQYRLSSLFASDHMVGRRPVCRYRFVQVNSGTRVVPKNRIEKKLLIATRPDTTSLVRWVKIELTASVVID